MEIFNGKKPIHCDLCGQRSCILQCTTERYYKHMHQLAEQHKSNNGNITMQANLASLIMNDNEDNLFLPYILLAFVPSDSESNNSFMPSFIDRNHDTPSSDE